MDAKKFEMFYFDDRTFIALCWQLEKELKGLKEWSGENAYDFRLVYQKFELFLAVYLQSKGRDDIDYKPDIRRQIAEDINWAVESEVSENVTSDFRSEKFSEAKTKLHKVMEDIIYQIRVVTI